MYHGVEGFPQLPCGRGPHDAMGISQHKGMCAANGVSNAYGKAALSESGQASGSRLGRWVPVGDILSAENEFVVVACHNTGVCRAVRPSSDPNLRPAKRGSTTPSTGSDGLIGTTRRAGPEHQALHAVQRREVSMLQEPVPHLDGLLRSERSDQGGVMWLRTGAPSNANRRWGPQNVLLCQRLDRYAPAAPVRGPALRQRTARTSRVGRARCRISARVIPDLPGGSRDR